MVDEYKKLSDEIWGYAETGFLEYKSCDAMCSFLEEKGFKVEKGIADMPTAYVGTAGHGKPVISFLGEYDALFSMNQKADVCAHDPITTADDTGHGCGHHLLGVGAIRAAVLYKEYLEKTGREGTVKIFGCPAEESGSGKAYLAREHYMDDTDVALTWHPGVQNQVSTGSSQSCISIFFKFHGISSHAAGAPQNGRSALDACELMNVGVNYLREHMESTDRVHYAYTNAGGKAPNVVPSEATLKYFVRSTTNPKCVALNERVIACAKGAAMMTGTTVDVIFDEGLSNTILNETLENVLKQSLKKCFKPDYTEEEKAYAQKFKDSFDPALMRNSVSNGISNRAEVLKDMELNPISTVIADTIHSEEPRMGSTDVGDISWVVPTAQINTACYSYGAGGHSWQWVAQGKSTIAWKGEMLAGEVLADAAAYLNEHPEEIVKAKKEFDEKLAGDTYKCLIPDDVKPHVSSVD